MAKFCVNCGSELVEGAKACGNCGTLIEEEVQVIDNTSTDNNTSTNTNVPAGSTVNVNVNTTPKKNTDLGVIGFWISLVSSILCCGSFNLISLILCIIGLSDCKNNPNNNKGMAIAGIVISCLGWIVTFIGAFLIEFFSYL